MAMKSTGGEAFVMSARLAEISESVNAGERRAFSLAYAHPKARQYAGAL
jgi:hypothetical protein